MNKRIKITTLLAFCFSLCQLAFSQGYKVKEFKFSPSDGSAFHAPNDAQGNPCGLVKIRTDGAGMVFEGNVVGEVENKVNEYWVYLSKGCHSLIIKHPNYLPLKVDFKAYGIDEISSKSTYIMSLTETKINKEKCGLLIIAKPEQAKVFIDDVLIDNLKGYGYYQLYLPKGDHICSITQEGFRPMVQVVQIGKGSQTINAELESVLSELEIKCKTGTAEVYVDGDLKGNGSWKGQLLPGEHRIEVRQKNFIDNSQMVTLEEKERRTIVVPELKRAKGKLRITTEPKSIPVFFDGKEIGISPCNIETTTGMHIVSCKTYGCKPYRAVVVINSESLMIFNAMLEYDDDLYREAYNGDKEAILGLASSASYDRYKGVHDKTEEAVFWVNRHPDKDKIVRHWRELYVTYYGENSIWWKHDWIAIYCELGNPQKALELFPDIQKDFGDMFVPEYHMREIGDAFFKKNNYEMAISCYQKANEEGYEGLGDCYAAKGDKQRAATYYKKTLNMDYYDSKKRVEKKLKDLGF